MQVFDHDRLDFGAWKYYVILHKSIGYNCECHYYYFLNDKKSVLKWFSNSFLIDLFIIALLTILIIRHVIGYNNYMKKIGICHVTQNQRKCDSV